jgi:beta-galactosidase
LDFSQFSKGVAFINGFNLGRYWEIGPARTLYIPAPLLKMGDNEIVLFETEGLNGPATVEFTNEHRWIQVK